MDAAGNACLHRACGFARRGRSAGAITRRAGAFTGRSKSFNRRAPLGSARARKALHYTSSRIAAGVEQPVFEFEIHGHDARGVDTEFGPQLRNRAPVTFQPAAVLVWTIPLRFPPRTRREELGVVRHVELAGVCDAPPFRAVVAKEHGVGVDLLEDLQVALGLDLQNGLRPRAEALDLRPGVGRAQILGALPVLELAPHERSPDGGCRTAFLDDDGVKLVGPVNFEDRVSVFESEEPLPLTAIQE